MLTVDIIKLTVYVRQIHIIYSMLTVDIIMLTIYIIENYHNCNIKPIKHEDEPVSAW